METFSLAVLAHLADPVRALVTLGGVLLWRNPRAMPIAAGMSAIVCETILTAGSFLDDLVYVWGEGIVAGLVACLAQAALLYLIVELVRRRREAPGMARTMRAAVHRSISAPQETSLVFGRPEPAE
jgi:hypothetical protein